MNNQKLTVSDKPPYDALQAFVRDNHIALQGLKEGPLAGLTFGIKDTFEIVGSTYSNGHPEWLRTHAPAEFTASIVTNMLEAGADLVGKTMCDELLFSLSGENWHYGSPINPHDPRRYCGGSSSGTAAAVAGGLVDFAIGTDCLGSIRVPPSYTGLMGIRASIGRIPADGQTPYSDSLDSSGFVAEDPEIFQKVSNVLLGEDDVTTDFKKLFIAEDSFSAVNQEVQQALKPAVDHIKGFFDEVTFGRISDTALKEWTDTLQFIQEYEVWETFGGWVKKYRPILSDSIKERLQRASKVTLSEYLQALTKREKIIKQVKQVIDNETVLCIPSTASVAPLRTSSDEEINENRTQTSKLLCVSPLTGMPQISLPLAEKEEVPLGISLLSTKNSDQQLVRLATKIMKAI